MERTKHLSQTKAACRIGGSCRCLTGLMLALLVLGWPADVTAQPVEAGYKKYFEQYQDRSWGEAILNRMGLTSGSVGRSFALVAGVANYPQLQRGQKQLEPAAEDIRKVVDFLKNDEVFDEIVVLQNADMTTENLRYFLRVYFPDQLIKHPKSRFFFAYSGHGFTIERDGVEEGYLLESDAHSMTDQVNSVDMSELRLWMDRPVGNAYQSLVLINACHSGAFLARAYGEDEERRLPSEPGAHVVTASGSGEKSWHDPSVGSASVFFEKFLAGAKDGHADTYRDGVVTIDELITYLRREVKMVRPDQSPLYADISKHGSKGGLFFLNRNRRVDPQVSQSLNPEAESFGGDTASLVVRCDVTCSVSVDGRSGVELAANEARTITVDPGEHLVAFRATDQPPQDEVVAVEAGMSKVVTVTFKETEAGESLPPTFTEPITGMPFGLIREGTFQRGSTGGSADEEPVRPVTISQPFYMGQYEVTQGQWKAVMGTEPWKGKDDVREGDDYPAVYVSWEDAQAFIERLNARDSGSRYRLPTEAEWEYAARAGSTTAYSFGDNEADFGEYAWCRANTWDMEEKYAQRVGQKRPNGWGLYDMHGNVWEWVSDRYDTGYYQNSPATDPEGPETGSYRVIRGGGWSSTARSARSAYRYRAPPGSRGDSLGFRLVRTAL